MPSRIGAGQSPWRNGPPSSCMLSDATDVDAASAARFFSGASRARIRCRPCSIRLRSLSEGIAVRRTASLSNERIDHSDRHRCHPEHRTRNHHPVSHAPVVNAPALDPRVPTRLETRIGWLWQQGVIAGVCENRRLINVVVGPTRSCNRWHYGSVALRRASVRAIPHTCGLGVGPQCYAIRGIVGGCRSSTLGETDRTSREITREIRWRL